MKKVLFSLLVFAALLFSQNTNAQAFKVGVFDLDVMVQYMPGYKAVDSALQIYQSDSLAAEYDFYQSEFKRLDSTYKLDSAAKKAPTVLDMEKQQRQQVLVNLYYWQQLSQDKYNNKKGQLAQHLYEQVAAAYKKVLEARKYDLVLKPNTYEFGSKIENVFSYVAKELKVPLPNELGGGQPEAGEAPQTAPPANKTPPKPSGTAKPKG